MTSLKLPVHPHKHNAVNNQSTMMFSRLATTLHAPIHFPEHARLLSTKLIRLNKRMSELNLASRREADRLIMAGQVMVQGQPAVLGQNIDPKEIDIHIASTSKREDKTPFAIVLNKPMGYVSSQPEDGHIPATRLLTRANQFAKRSFEFDFQNHHSAPSGSDPTLSNFVAGGRLDLDSRGLMIFSRSGVIRRRLVSDDGKLEKEYLVQLEQAVQPTRREMEAGFLKLPLPTLDLSQLHRGGALLSGDDKPLRPIKARWEEPGITLRMVLREGRKHQIRRMCRELLGWHVIDLLRIRVGPIKLHQLPEGKWRPLNENEIEIILNGAERE